MMPIYDGQPLTFPHPTELGVKLRKARASTDMLLYDMAQMFGVTPAVLSGAETGRTVWPDDLKAAAKKWLSEREGE